MKNMMERKEKGKKILKKICKKGAIIIGYIIALNVAQQLNVFGANDDPLTVINNLSDFIFGLLAGAAAKGNCPVAANSGGYGKKPFVQRAEKAKAGAVG